jgi:hypothetical protein
VVGGCASVRNHISACVSRNKRKDGWLVSEVNCMLTLRVPMRRVVWLIGVGGGVILCVWLCCVRRGVLNSDGNLVSRWIVCVGVVGHRVVRMF